MCPGDPRALEGGMGPMETPPLLSPFAVPAGDRFLLGSGDGLNSFHRLVPCM